MQRTSCFSTEQIGADLFSARPSQSHTHKATTHMSGANKLSRGPQRIIRDIKVVPGEISSQQTGEASMISIAAWLRTARLPLPWRQRAQACSSETQVIRGR